MGKNFALKELKNDRWEKVLKLIFEVNPKKLLDIGSSKEEISELLIAQGIDVYGLDFDEAAVERAKKIGVKAKVHDVSKGLPFEDKTFDLIFAGEIIEHLVDTDDFLKEIHRVLREDGELIITTPNMASLENRLRLLLGRQPLYVDYTSRGDNHVRAYVPRALVDQLKEKQFSIKVCTGSFVPPFFYSLFKGFTQKMMPVLGKLGTLLPSLAVHIIIKAKKV